MNNSLFKFLFVAVLITLAGCAEKPVNPKNPPGMQRDHADQANRELSTEVRK